MNLIEKVSSLAWDRRFVIGLIAGAIVGLLILAAALTFLFNSKNKPFALMDQYQTCVHAYDDQPGEACNCMNTTLTQMEDSPELPDEWVWRRREYWRFRCT